MMQMKRGTRIRNAGLASVLLFTAACSALPSGGAAGDGDLVPCSDPRPEMCTMQYDPVCGRIGDDETWKSYASDCSACSDPAVSGYLPGGECRVDGAPR